MTGIADLFKNQLAPTAAAMTEFKDLNAKLSERLESLEMHLCMTDVREEKLETTCDDLVRKSGSFPGNLEEKIQEASRST